VPTIQLSLDQSLDPARHLAIGRALAPLRDEDVLVAGSGMSFHNMRAFRSGGAHRPAATAFDEALGRVVTADPDARDAGLARWAELPSARDVHPREEHLIPLMVAAGAAGADRGRVAWNDTFGGMRISAVHFS
jgi:aromatic ring-opening dioxygenase catalytic subunit (LigB family)